MIEEFRKPVVDKAVIGMIRKKQKLAMEGINLSQKTKTEVIKKVLRRLDSFVKFRGKRLTLRNIINSQADSITKFLEGKGKYHSFIDRW